MSKTKVVGLGTKWQQYTSSVEKWIRDLRLNVKHGRISEPQEIKALLKAATELTKGREEVWENMPAKEWWKLGRIARRLGAIGISYL